MDNVIIHTWRQARDQNPIYFKQFGPRKKGDNVLPIGNIHANGNAKASFYVVRLSHRTPTWRKEYQHVRLTDRRAYKQAGQLYPRCYYITTSVSYLIVRQAWDTGDITEISAHPTRRAAVAALSQYLKSPTISLNGAA